MQFKDSEYAHRYTATGLGTTILANRISHVFNLQSPSSVIDTACSSSLYCLHAACTALQAGECDSAVVACANLIQSPEQQLETMKAGVLSKTSTCHTFDSSADGYGRADGIGAFLVKRLSDAIRDGDAVRAVIRGTAVNSNGKTNGITLPSADGQEAVIRKAYAQAGLGYEETAYVECHGTGTAVGDPIEVEAVSRVFKKQEGSPPLIGSVKSHLGHSEAASGISSIIKVVLALENKEIPPTVGVKSINPKIKLDDWKIQIVTQVTPCPDTSPHKSSDGIRRAGVNSFGYGGANAHAILEAAEHHLPLGYMSPSVKQAATLSRTTMLLPVSASSDTALKRRVSDLSALDLSCVNITDLAHTLGMKRSHLSARGYVLVRPESLQEDFILENTHIRLEGKPYSKLPLAFVFTGQGAQWAEMGVELIHEYPSFRQTIQVLDSTLQLLPHPPNWTLLGALLEPAKTSMINHASRSQPVCRAIQVAMIQLLSTCGIKPEKVVGHSSGEIAAAYATGHITAEQAITIAYYRGYVTRSPNAMVGAMMAVGLGRTDAEEHIDALGLDNQICVACVNSPESVTISGDIDGIDKLKTHLDTLSIFARQLKTNGKAYHSHHMAAVGQEYEEYLIGAASEINSPKMNGSLPSSSGVQWISSVTEEIVDKHLVRPSYWRANLESPVLFSNVVEKLLQDFGPHHLIEIGPHSALEMPIRQIRTNLKMGEDKVHYGAALSRGKDSVITFLNLVGNLYLHGHSISFKHVNVVQSSPFRTKGGYAAQQGKMLLDLPNYAWDYDSQPMINEPRVSVEWRNRKHPRHDILGSQVHGGNGITTTWRNVLKVKDIPWVEGHKLDTTVVFPAAGYLAMAIEAMRQVAGINDVDEACALKLRDVTITKALVLGQEANDAGVEIFTTLQPAQLPGHVDTEWHQFNISSYSGEEATTHAKGLIQLAKAYDYATVLSLPTVKPEGMEPSAPRTWYNKFAEGGLNFQGRFQSLSQIHLHRKREDTHVLAKTGLRQTEGDDKNPESTYMLHPVTIDSLFQAGIMASTSGIVRELRAKVPVHIEEIIIRSPTHDHSKVSEENELNIKAVSEPVGFGTIRVSAELYGDNGLPVLQISRCRQVAYQSGTRQQDGGDERHPMLRVIWKPDISRLGPNDQAAFSTYIEQQATHAATSSAGKQDASLTRLGTALDLLVHKNARLRILSLFADEKDNNYFIDILRLTTAFKRCQSLWRGTYENGSIKCVEYSSDDESEGKPRGDGSDFDLVLLGPQSNNTSIDLAAIRDLIAENGTLLSVTGSDEASTLNKLGFTTLQTQLGGAYETILAHPPSKESSGKKKAAVSGEILIVERNTHHTLNSAVANQVYQTTGHHAKRVSLEKITPSLLSTHSAVITTIELETPTLSRVTEEEMRLIKILTDNCTNLIWVTGGQLLQGSQPEMAVAFGLSRALMLEQPSLRFFVIDVDVNTNTATPDIETTARHVFKVLQQAIEDPEPDFEFVQAAGMLHVSRFVPSEWKNRVFREKQGSEKTALTLGEARPCRLDIEQVGHTDGIFFRREETYAEEPLKAGDVEVSVMAVGLSTRDLQAISGNAKNSSGSICTSQYAAIVSRVGAGVESLAPGDRVVVMAPGSFSTKERVAEWACQKLNDNEDFTGVACLPLALSAAIYAINTRAHLQPNESILICCGGSDIGADLVAVRMAQLICSQVFVVATNEDQKNVFSDFKLPQGQVFVANDPELDVKLLAATKDRGLDVIVAFADDKPPGVILNRSIISAISADCARLVQVGVGGPSLVDAVVMDPRMSRRSITVTQFDMGSLIALQTPNGQNMRRRLLSDAMSPYRSGDLATIDLSPDVWDISAVREAFDSLASPKVEKGSHNGGVVVSLENDTSSVPVLPIKYDTTFSPDKTYLLVGCLGGLGRSMSKWMLTRGARKFVFLGRSGTDRAPARRLVEDLEFSGAQVTVVRGDVVNLEDVERAVASIDGAIGGVIQAAMGLDEALFTTMSRQYWLNGLKPKIVGSWNLHNAIRGHDQELDFFLMTSSVSGSVGTATESNYCSANYFLDVFARYRRGLGLPATSVGLGMISEVGYLHENPEIEALLLRKGIQAINEDEMLQIIDIALSQQTDVPNTTGDAYDELGLGHVLTGLEPLGLRELRAKGFEGTSPVLGDPRASLLSAALDEETSGSGSGSGSGSTNGLAAEIAEAINSGSSVTEAALAMVVTKFSSLVLMPKDKIDVHKPMSGVGIDSMLAAEFRAWVFQAFKVDVPYLTLLSSTATLSTISELISQTLMKVREDDA
ncbi:ketoacyl-synt-domain-containing protein [Annulohypoxylon maeteangense]|uniref:ketoacyl-synt-domain-containing protein n=1 Tax=Annulohypoxylon maeteangense TaxID=1927788 RepID=UPI002007420B|nr:ketoacyl-synt-domain-containing protein [Annulohypoxylon maeteangense]KAI0886290.1 ketoacyl-synt-domain-containing protein [Annulohypoxylon maeteangense]